MRIIGGTLKGRKFDPPITHWKTRPTTDFGKEALFNILDNQLDLEVTKALDLFAGTGNISFELVSRGCPKVVAVEKFFAAVRFIRKLSVELDVEDRLEVVQQDVRKYLEKTDTVFDLIFADPPYELGWIDGLPEMIMASAAVKPETVIVIEHGPSTDFSGNPHCYDERKYGQSRFSFFKGKV